jgi:DNA-binding NtrC family response regulator
MTRKIKFEVVPQAEARNKEVDSARDERPVVLVVDDERVIADTLAIILAHSGFATMTAYNAEGALQQASATPPDLVISDVMMPGMNGVDLAITITQSIPACKVLLFSGQAATFQLLEAARLSGHNFTLLNKPVHPTDMLRSVSECLSTANPAFKPVSRPADAMSASRPAALVQ